MKRYYFLPFANFLAAIGGGIILSAGIGALKGTLLEDSEGSILAFFAGAVIGLLLHRIVPKRWSRVRAPWFSISVGFASIILYELYGIYAVDKRLTGIAGIFFIALLSVRYGLWFFSRAWRSQIVGSEKQGIALIELGYYAGVALGLIIWENLNYEMSSALLVDAVMQSVAGLIDLFVISELQYLNNLWPNIQVVKQERRVASNIENNETVEKLPFDYKWYCRLAVAVVCLTIGFQAVPFSLTHWVADDRKIYILACFYIGVALSALVCRVFKIKFGWDSINNRLAGKATINSEITRIKLKSGFGLITLMAATSLVAALLDIKFQQQRASLSALIFISLAAFIYQILVLSLMDQIGRAEKLSNLNEMIKLTLLIAAVATIISIGILNYFKISYFGCVLLTLSCCLVSFLAVRKRVEGHA